MQVPIFFQEKRLEVGFSLRLVALMQPHLFLLIHWEPNACSDADLGDECILLQ